MYFLGVDGGQSSTRAAVGDGAGRLLGRGAAGPCNHVGAGEGAAKLRRVVAEVARGACADAGLAADTRFKAACLGMSGGPDDKRAILREAVRAEAVAVVTDAEIALAGAADGGPGVVVIAGTGSIAYGRNKAGRTARAGGWGYVFGDEGGAFDIVRRALRAGLAAEEGWGPPTQLADAIRTAASAKTMNEALHRFYTDAWPRGRIAALAPLAQQAAAAGDRVAAGVLREAGRLLADLANAVCRNLSPDAAERLPVYPVGGVFAGEAAHDSFKDALTGCARYAGRPRREPVVGALILAYRAAGLRPAVQETP